jgi:Reverse transcriptase (RNA-dependent DNA polymerase)/Bacitracin resistance protein BacA
VRRTYIPKSDGRQRPLGVTALEDKIVQRAAVEVLNAIYEEDFADFSYGFRPGRSQHQALDQLFLGIHGKKVNWVLDLDIRSFFDTWSQSWLVKYVEHRIGDRRVVRLIQKWLRAGVIEEEKLTVSEEGTPQGGSLAGVAKSRAETFSFALAVVLTPPVVLREAMRLIHAQHISGTADLASALFPSVLGAVLAFFAGLLALRWLSRWLEGGRWYLFGIYCLAAAAGVAGLHHAGY